MEQLVLGDKYLQRVYLEYNGLVLAKISPLRTLSGDCFFASWYRQIDPPTPSSVSGTFGYFHSVRSAQLFIRKNVFPTSPAKWKRFEAL